MNQINTTEDSLRAEIDALKRQMAEQSKVLAAHERRASRPSTGALVFLALLLAALTAGGRVTGAWRRWPPSRRPLPRACPWSPW